MLDPTVSILIPVYNREEFISECIQSALDQDYSHLEIIIVDNHSTDRTWEICQSFARAHSNVKAYQNPENIGPVRNWRACAEKASGEFSKILFSDDLISNDCISRMTPHLRDQSVGLVFCGFDVGADGDFAPISHSEDAAETLSANKFLPRLFTGKAPMSPGAYMLRTKDILTYLQDDIPTISPHDYKGHGAGPDIFMLLQTAEQYRKVTYLPDTLCFFRSHPGSITISSRNFEIERAYASAFMHYYRKTRSSTEAISVISMLWLRELNRTRHWVRVRPFFQTHGLSKGPLETLQFYWFTLCHALSKMFSRSGQM